MKRPQARFAVILLVAVGGVVSLLFPPPVRAVPPSDRGQLPNGLRYVLVQLPPGWGAMVTVLVGAGPAFEPVGSQGVAYLAARNLLAVTHSPSAGALGTEVARPGSRIIPSVGPESVGFTIAAGDQDWGPALGLASRLIRNPAYPASVIEEAVRAAEEERRNAQAKLSWLLGWHLLRLLAGETGHARVLEQVPTVVSAASPANLRAFHALRFRPSTTVVGIGAPAPVAKLRDGLLAAFADWAPAHARPPGADKIPAEPPGAVTLIVNRPGDEVAFGWQRTAPALPDGDTHAYLMLAAILNRRLQASASFASPSRRPSVGYQGLKKVGWLRVTWHGPPEDLALRVRTLFSELQRLRTSPATPREVADARERVTHNLDAMVALGPDLVPHLAARELLGLGERPLYEHRDVLPAVTPERLLTLAGRWLDAQRSATVFIGDTRQMDVLF